MIRLSKPPWAFRKLLVKKVDGSWRPCVDDRKLNTLTMKDNYLLPVIDNLLIQFRSLENSIKPQRHSKTAGLYERLAVAAFQKLTGKKKLVLGKTY